MFLPRTRNKRYIDKIIENYNGVKVQGIGYDLKLLFDKLYSIYELVEIIEVEKDSNKEYNTYIYNNEIDAYLLYVHPKRIYFSLVDCKEVCTDQYYIDTIKGYSVRRNALPKLNSNMIYYLGLPSGTKVFMLICTGKKIDTYLREIDCYRDKEERCIIRRKIGDLLVGLLWNVGIFLCAYTITECIIVPIVKLFIK